MKHTKIGFSLAVIVCLLAAWSAPVLSQDQDQSSSSFMEEIIVTARRREESLSDVPGTVTAFTAATLERAGVQRAADFLAMTPGVTMVDAAEIGDTQVNIRGINGTRDAENSFAFILDGVLYTNPAAFNREYTDLQQIEVFKGPQGAIYGRNAAAGAIIVTTTKPGDERASKVSISTAQDSTNLFKFSTSGKASNGKTSYRISGDWRESDGFYRNSFQNQAPIVDAYEGFNLNARIIHEPNDNLTIDTKFRIGEVDASAITFNSTFNLPVFAAALSNPPANQDVNDFDFVFHPNIVSDNDQESLEFSTKFDYDMSGKVMTGWLLYSDIENNLISDGTSAAFGFYNPDPVCQQTVLDLGWAGSAFPLLAPQFIGMTPTGVIFDPNGSFLGAYTPTTCDGIQEQLRNQKDLSMELRLASDDDNALQWMVGGYFLDIDREVGVSLNRDGGGVPTRGLYQAGGANATASLAHDQFDSRVYALFGQIEYDVNDNVEISFAVRYDSEKREVHSLVPFGATQSVIDLNFDGVFNDPLNPALSSLINTTGTIPDKSETFSEFQPKLAVTWDATDTTTVFASWGVGFKAGGFNNSGSAATVNIFNNGFINGGIGINFADQLGVPLPVINDNFKKETSSAFELGFNSNLLDGRLQLNGAYYDTSVDDMQFFEFFVGTFGLLRVVSNLDDVDISGYELGATFHASEHARFYLGGNFIDSEIKANSSRPDTVGNEAPYTPEHTINFGADFDFDISSSMSAFARVDAQIVGETWFHTVQTGQRPTIFMPLFELGFGAGAGALGIADFSNARRDEYTTVDLHFGIRGDNWTLTVFGQNLTDEKYLEEVIPAPEFGGSFDHPGSQRRYGLELSLEF
ncbi:MAG: iron complex outermembrane receptor protein [Lysobacterales bacterium]|jgi:iron complex outermembrane receptor protein